MYIYKNFNTKFYTNCTKSPPHGEGNRTIAPN